MYKYILQTKILTSVLESHIYMHTHTYTHTHTHYMHVLVSQTSRIAKIRYDTQEESSYSKALYLRNCYREKET